MIKSFRDVVELWPVPDALAAEIGASHWAVQKWRHRNAIPAEWWLRILQTPTAKKHGLKSDLFAALAGREKVA